MTQTLVVQLFRDDHKIQEINKAYKAQETDKFTRLTRLLLKVIRVAWR